MVGKITKSKDGIVYINKRNITKEKNDMYIWSSDEMDWIIAPLNTKPGDIVKWARKEHKILASTDKLTGTPRLTYNRLK